MRVSGSLVACALLLAACGGGGHSGDQSPQRGITAAQLNLLHGSFGGCMRSDNCRLADRVDLLFDWIGDSGCPDIVTLQEVSTKSASLIMDRLGDACPFMYEAVLGDRSLGVDDEMVLSRHPVLDSAHHPLFPGFRKALWVRVDHPLGPVDVFTTHLASGSDGGPSPCGATCPPECVAGGALTRRDCQAVQLAAFVEATHDVDTPAVIAGDFNAEPGSFTYRTFTERGWSDVHLAAGNPECDPASGVGCTSGREDSSLVDLESPASNEVERIDFIFLVPPRNGFACTVQLDPASDRDGDGSATRIFADRPNPFAPACGAAPLPICWPSDHEGVELDLNCG